MDKSFQKQQNLARPEWGRPYSGRLMDLRSPFSFWQIKNGLIANYPPLDRDLDCDVAVIGGGITGAITAHSLAQAKFETVVLDRGDVALGSTAASTGLLIYDLDLDLFRLVEMIGKDRAVRSYQLSLEAVRGLGDLAADVGDCDFQRKKCLYFAARKGDVERLRREYQERRAHGMPVDFLNAKQVRAEFGFDSPAGIVSHEAAQVDPYRMTHRLLLKGMERGLQVYDRTAVTGVVRKGAQWVQKFVLRTDRGPRVTARRVVFATGYEAQPHLPRRLLRFVSTFAIVTEPVSNFNPWSQSYLMVDTLRPYHYYRNTSDGRHMLGGEDANITDAARRERLVSSKSRTLSRLLGKVVPVAKHEIAYAWAGVFGQSKDSLGFIGEIKGMRGCYYAVCAGGNGMNFSIVAANMITSAISGKPDKDMEIFRADR